MIQYWAERAAAADLADPPSIPGPGIFFWQKVREALAGTFEDRDGVAFVNAYREELGQKPL